MDPTASTGPPLEPPEDDISPSGDRELSAENLAALQEDIHKMENPNFACQKLKVRELFNRGVPFFTKSELENVKDQLNTIKSMVESGRSIAGQKFVLSSITGQTVERPVPEWLIRPRQFGKETVLYVFHPSSTHGLE